MLIIVLFWINYDDCVVFMQILPSVKEALKFKKGKRRKCHWCRKSSYRILVRCKGCQKESFCEDCIGERFVRIYLLVLVYMKLVCCLLLFFKS